MDRKRYLLALLVGGAEAGTIFAVGELLHGSTTSAWIGLTVAVAFLGGGVWDSVHTRTYAHTMFPDTRPPASWIVAFVGAGSASLAFGAYLVLDASNGGIIFAVWRIVGGLWFLSISSALSLACYHLWRDVPKRQDR